MNKKEEIEKAVAKLIMELISEKHLHIYSTLDLSKWDLLEDGHAYPLGGEHNCLNPNCPANAQKRRPYYSIIPLDPIT